MRRLFRARTLMIAFCGWAASAEVAYAAGALANGDNVQGTIVSKQVDTWTFTAAVSDAISVSMSEVGTNTTFQPWIRVLGPTGQLLGQAAGDLSAEVDLTASTAGVYTVQASRYDSTTAGGAYVLTLAKAPGTFVVPTGDEGGPISNGGNYAGKILRGDLDQWTFSATAGDAISLTVSEVGTNTTFQPWIRVHAPNGALVGNATGALSAEADFTASLTGTYTVLISRYDHTDGTGQYLLTLAKAPGAVTVPSGDEGGPIVDGGNYTGTILRGDLDQWTFSATAGNAISLTVSEVGTNTTFQPWIRVHAPNGALVGNATGALSAEADFTASLTGTYTVLISRYDSTDGTGQYVLTLAKAPGTVIVPSGDEGGPISNGGNYTGTILRGDLDQWTFSATAGNAISLTVSEVGTNTTFQPWIRVHAPNGALVGNATGALSAEADFTASVTGTYTVLISRYDHTDGIGQYVLTLAKAPGSVIVPSGDEGGPIVNGGNYTGKILRGDLDQWTFSATAGDAVSVTVSEVGTNTTFQPWIRVHAPNGALVGNATGNLSAEADFTASLTGTYTVLISRYDNTDGIGQYLLTLAKAPGAVTVPSGDEGGPIVNGGNYTGKILRGDLDQWTFSATAGDAISVTVSEVGTNTTFQPWIRVHAPNGALVGNATGNLSAEADFTASLTGTYTVLISRYDNTDGTGTYLLTLAQAPGTFTVPSGDDGGPLVAGVNPAGTILRGDLDQWRFNAVTGNKVSITVNEVGTDTTFQPWIRVHAPNGALVGNATGGVSATAAFTASLTGSYTVLIARYDNTDGTGTYQITSSHAGTGSQSMPAPQISSKLLGNPGEPPNQPGCMCDGDTVALGPGNKFQEVKDYETSTTNKLGFSRYYNSSIGSGPPTLATSLGANWRGTFDRYLRVVGPSTVIAERADGRALTFTLNAGVWAGDTDVDLHLTQMGSTWTLIDRNDTSEIYQAISATEAILTRIQDRTGYTQSPQYDSDGQLTTVVDSFGRSLQFTYRNGLLETLTTPDGLILAYRYDSSGAKAGANDRLASVAYSSSPPANQTYLYENESFPFALTGIIDEEGSRAATWLYDTAGRPTSSHHGNGAQRVEIVYNADGSRVVTNALGQQEVYAFATLQGVPKVTRITRVAAATTAAGTRSFTYDENGYTASQADWNGNLTTYVNDLRGQPTAMTEHSGTPQSLTTTITYSEKFHLPVKIVKPGLMTEMNYDAAGNLLSRTLTDTTTTTVPYSTNGARRTWTYTWNEFGLLASVKGPRLDVDQTTRFSYDASGTLIRMTNALGQQASVTLHTPGGSPQMIVDANNVTRQFTYDGRLRLVSPVMSKPGLPHSAEPNDAADDSAFTSGYDAAKHLANTSGLPLGRLLREKGADLIVPSANQGATTYVYDGFGDPIQARNPDTGDTTYYYDAAGNLTQSVDGGGATANYNYDALDRLLSAAYPADAKKNVTYQYDRPGHAPGEIAQPKLR